jgi:hypothetical protein
VGHRTQEEMMGVDREWTHILDEDKRKKEGRTLECRRRQKKEGETLECTQTKTAHTKEAIRKPCRT